MINRGITQDGVILTTASSQKRIQLLQSRRSNSLNTLVSIIVPIYKVEPFVEKCIQSVLAQTYEDLEIILVDDGSPDNCGRIIDRFKEANPNIIVIHKKNGGVSAARNDGMAIASGEYVMFVDGDDYVEPDYVSYFVSLLERDNSDMAVSTKVFTKDGQPQCPEEYYVSDAARIVEGIYLNQIGVAVWNKIYRKKILTEIELSFNTDFWFAEGMLFNISYLQFIKNVAVGQRRVYHFAENNNSATRLFNINSYLCGLKSMEYQRDHWLYSDNQIKMAWEYHYRRYAELILRGLLETNTTKEHYVIFDACQDALKRDLRIPIQVDINIWAKTESLRMAIDPLLVLCPQGFSQRKGWDMKWKQFLIKLVYKTPVKIWKFIFETMKKYYNWHYKPVYLEKKLL